MGCREYHLLERPSDDDAPDGSAWLNRAADEMERRGYNMIGESSYDMRMDWWSTLTGRRT